MRKFAFLAIALVVVGALVGARIVGAQETGPGRIVPAICTDTNFDMDHDGIVSQSDAAAWKALASQCGNRESGQGFISAESCRQILGDPDFDLVDVNGDGVLDLDDHALMGGRLSACSPAFVRLPR